MNSSALKIIEFILQKAPRPVKLVAVTKYAALPDIQRLIEWGIVAIAENRVEAAGEKFPHLPPVEKHFIGQIQSRKIRRIVELFDVIQSVGSIDHLNKIDQMAGELGKKIQVFLQFNISGENQKSGFKPDQLNKIAEALFRIQVVQVIGLMGMASDTQDQDLIRRQFATLRELRDQLRKEFPHITELSMGMSSDYPIAIEEGATVVRIGRGIVKI